MGPLRSVEAGSGDHPAGEGRGDGRAQRRRLGAIYLKRVFRDDPDFHQAAENWAVEEIQHGDALGRRGGELADPGWNYAEAFGRYRAGYKIDINADASIRGSRTGELIARCMVETGPAATTPPWPRRPTSRC